MSDNKTTAEEVKATAKEEVPSLLAEGIDGSTNVAKDDGIIRLPMCSISDLPEGTQKKNVYTPEDLLKIIRAHKAEKSNLATHVVALRDYTRTTRCAYGLNDVHDLRLFSKQSKKHIREVLDLLVKAGWQCWGSSKQFYSLTKGLNDLIPTASLNIDLGSDNVIYMVIGDYEAMVEVLDIFNQHMNEEKATYDYLTSGDGRDGYSVSEIELTAESFPKAYDAFYPCIKSAGYTGVDDLVDDYLNSEESVLLFAGPPGTGKTTLTAAIANKARDKFRIIVCTDAALIAGNPGAIIKHIERYAENGEDVCAIIEDADALLNKTRREGNIVMNSLLSITNGYGPTRSTNLKIVFTSNLLDTSKIDSALLRPGRCFGVHFIGPLTLEQAQEVAKIVGSKWTPECTNEQYVSLAEIASYNPRRIMESSTDGSATVGFAAPVDEDMLKYVLQMSGEEEKQDPTVPVDKDAVGMDVVPGAPDEDDDEDYDY